MPGAIRDGGDGGDGLPGVLGRGAIGSAARGRDCPQPGPHCGGPEAATGPGHLGTGHPQELSHAAGLDLGRALPAREKAGRPGTSARRTPSGGAGHSGATAPRTWRWAPCPAALRALRKNCFTAPKFVRPRSRGPGCGWHPLLARVPAFACRESPAGVRQRAAPPEGQRGGPESRISYLVSDAQATGLLSGNPSGSLGKAGWHGGRRSA